MTFTTKPIAGFRVDAHEPIPVVPAPPAVAIPDGDSCDTCRFHSKGKGPRILGAAEPILEGDSQIEVDGVVDIYTCRAKSGPHAGRTVGPVPVKCDAFEAGKKASLEEKARLDKLMGRFK